MKPDKYIELEHEEPKLNLSYVIWLEAQVKALESRLTRKGGVE